MNRKCKFNSLIFKLLILQIQLINMKSKYNIIGLMSGTSLDGLDIAHCTFNLLDNKWHYEINHAETVKYSPEWILRLSNLETQSALELAKTNMEFGNLLGYSCFNFIQKKKISVDFISSHGHTIFHQPALGLTYQIGSGASIAARSKLPVVCDFRSLDIALKGQGAPLVPIGDRLLFPEHTYRLNLGGFANISYEDENTTLAFDICPANMACNYLSGLLNKEYDESGEIARSGDINHLLLEDLNNLIFYTLSHPKSLGKEWFLEVFKPVLDRFSISINDKLRTVNEHVALQICKQIKKNGNILITGGGAYNTFLIERIKTYSKFEIIIPSPNIVEYKEALIFAFLGLLRWQGRANCLKSVTGAISDNVGGAIYKPFE